MKAIVLTFDKHIQVANLVLHTYKKMWPSNPFVFRVPYNDVFPSELKKNYGDKVELIKTKKEIKFTIETLLSGIGDDEWVWWCMDDKYIIELDEDGANKIYNFVRTLKDPSIGGVMITRNDSVNSRLIYDSNITSPQGQLFYEKRDYRGFYQHYFIKARVLKRVLLDPSVPDDYKLAKNKNVDNIIGAHKVKGVATRSNEKVYVPQISMATFGESTIRGKITLNCRRAFSKHKLPLPNIGTCLRFYIYYPEGSLGSYFMLIIKIKRKIFSLFG